MCRFIPTHVGNTFWSGVTHSDTTVHPHACGEHVDTLAIPSCSDGSSPRMWGTHLQRSLVTSIYRFIPTHVGNTMFMLFHTVIDPVHPHACGEHSTICLISVSIYGSSPRMWGTLTMMKKSQMLLRFIPTHVGNTLFPCSVAVPSAVHPHACGEHRF